MCKGCKDENLPCSRGLPGPNGERCPLIENAPSTLEEVQAGDAIAVSGYHLPTAIEVLAANGWKNGVTVELAAVACTGLREGMQVKEGKTAKDVS